MYKNTSLINPMRNGIVKNNQLARVSENEAYQLATIVHDLFKSNGIKCEIQQTISKEKSPEAFIKVNSSGIKIKLGFSYKTKIVTKLTPKGGIFDE